MYKYNVWLAISVHEVDNSTWRTLNYYNEIHQIWWFITRYIKYGGLARWSLITNPPPSYQHISQISEQGLAVYYWYRYCSRISPLPVTWFSLERVGCIYPLDLRRMFLYLMRVDLQPPSGKHLGVWTSLPENLLSTIKYMIKFTHNKMLTLHYST